MEPGGVGSRKTSTLETKPINRLGAERKTDRDGGRAHQGEHAQQRVQGPSVTSRQEHATIDLCINHTNITPNPPKNKQLARQNTTRKVKNHYQYVVLGAGTTAYAAIETIFNRQPDADILLISNEAVRQYSP